MKTIIKITWYTFLLFLTIIISSCSDNTPKSWFKAGSNPDSYGIGIDKSIFQNGEKSAYLTSNFASITEFGTLMQTCSAKEYSGKKVKLSGFIKSENVTGWSGLWFRIDANKNAGSKYFDNMQDRPVKGDSDWNNYEIVLDVPQNSYSMNFGILLAGSGKVWIDNLSFEIIGNSSEKFNDSLSIARSFELNSKPQNLNFEK